MNLKTKSNRCAFTLIEVMLAITLFSLVVAAIYSTWSLTLRASKIGQEAAAQAQRQRMAVRTIEDSLVTIQSFQASIQYYDFVVQNGDAPMLSFVARLPDDFPRNGRFGDFNLRRLTFTVEPGPDSEPDLVLRQNPILMDVDQDEQNVPLVIARNVKLFAVECWDTNALAWTDEWDDTNSIPPMVRVSLALGGKQNDSGNSSPALAVSRVIEIPATTVPTALQTGRAGGGGGGGGGNGGTRRNPPNVPNPNQSAAPAR